MRSTFILKLQVFLTIVVICVSGCGGGGGDSTSSGSVTPPPPSTTVGTASNPYDEAVLVAAGNLTPNGFVKSSKSGTVYDLRLGGPSSPLTLSTSDSVTLSLQSLGNTYLTYNRLDGGVYNETLAFSYLSNQQAIGYSSRTMQNSWIEQPVATAWANGYNGTQISVITLDDFTPDDWDEIRTIPAQAPGCFSLNVSGGLAWFCPNTNSFLYPMTHGDQVTLILSGQLNNLGLLQVVYGPYANAANPTTMLGYLTMRQEWKATFSTPLYGVAFGAKATTKRDDYLTYQRNTSGLFNQLQLWGAGSDVASIGYQRTKVVNLSLGKTSTNPVINKADYTGQLAYANASIVPDAVFVKASGNNACYISSTNCDPYNAVFNNSSSYRDKTLIVGALTASGGAIASYSNKAGSYSDRFVVADGRSLQENNGTYIQGTSFAAPRVSGYAAILRQKYPNLSATAIAGLILSSAKWNNAWGAKGATTQAIYGQGEADLGQALTAVGYLP